MTDGKKPTKILVYLDKMLPELETLYKDIHSHPELSMQETRTAGIAADHLRASGFEVTTGVGKTGVVGILRNGDGPTRGLIWLAATRWRAPMPSQERRRARDQGSADRRIRRKARWDPWCPSGHEAQRARSSRARKSRQPGSTETQAGRHPNPCTSERSTSGSSQNST